MYPGAQYVRPDWQEKTIAEMQEFALEHRELLTECTRVGRFPRDLFLEMGRRGWVGPVTSVEEGGAGVGVNEYCLLEEEIGRLGLVSVQVSVQGQLWLNLWGSEEQKKRYLRGMARGELIFAEAISEPEVGSSLKLMKATARRDGSDWILNGEKTHVNMGHDSDLMIIYAMAEEGLTSFLVETREEGVSTEQTDPIGYRLLPTADVVFDSVRSSRLGAAGCSWRRSQDLSFHVQHEPPGERFRTHWLWPPGTGRGD